MRGLLLFSAAFGIYHGFLNPAALNHIMALAPNVESPANTTSLIEDLAKNITKTLLQKNPSTKVYITTLDESTGKPIAQYQSIVPKVRQIIEENKIQVTDELSANCTLVIKLLKENKSVGQNFAIDAYKVEQGKTTKLPFVTGTAGSNKNPDFSSSAIVPGKGTNGETGASIIDITKPDVKPGTTIDKKKITENIFSAYTARKYVIPPVGTKLKFGPDKCLDVWVAVAQLSEIKNKNQIDTNEFKERNLENYGAEKGTLILNPKERYIVGIKNNGKEPLGIFLNIDGIPFDNFKKGDLAKEGPLGYLIEPDQTIYFSGWLIDSKNISAFDVQEYPPSHTGTVHSNGSIQVACAIAKKEGPEAEAYKKELDALGIGDQGVETRKPDQNGSLQAQDTLKSNYLLFNKVSFLTINYDQNNKKK